MRQELGSQAMINPAARETANRGSCSQAEAEPTSHRAKTFHSWQMAALRLRVAACLVVAVANPLAMRTCRGTVPCCRGRSCHGNRDEGISSLRDERG
jgi:hypothetical protein